MEEQIQIQGDQNLELVLVTASINHEYAKKEFEKTHSFHRREELLVRMSDLKRLYFNAREAMKLADPDKLSAIEEELRSQKQNVLNEYLN
ncbi:MAG: hypothetical protein HYW02_06530 [Deltaproteobacteria bacterium]|nr:hypothetical protein [Deltaproteobacteria bacterium]